MARAPYDDDDDYGGDDDNCDEDDDEEEGEGDELRMLYFFISIILPSSWFSKMVKYAKCSKRNVDRFQFFSSILKSVD